MARALPVLNDLFGSIDAILLTRQSHVARRDALLRQAPALALSHFSKRTGASVTLIGRHLLLKVSR